MNVISVLLVDDQLSVRIGLRMRLEIEPDMVIVGEAADGRAGLAVAEQLQPNVVVMDVAMPDMDGIAATALLRARCPHSAVVILTLYSDPATRACALAAGAAAFVEKPPMGHTLAAAIRMAAGAGTAMAAGAPDAV